jgi:hypothetical protein
MMNGRTTMAKRTLTQEEMEAIRVRYELISKWGADTISMFEKSVKTDRPSDRLCITTLSLCSTYVNAIIVLLQNGLRMPTKALLRILFEVSAKVLWCLAERDTDDSESAVEERILRWAKASLKQDIKLRRNHLKIVPEEGRAKLEQSIKESERMLDEWGFTPMNTNFYALLGELSDAWPKQFYPQLYERFNSAVHLDFASLLNKARDDGTTISVTNDSSERIEELAQYCVVNMHIIIFAIREHYGWDSAAMNKEFKAVNQS